MTFEIRTALGPILQDVPVTVLSAVRLAECVEPENPNVTGFTLPPLARLHSVVERMRGIGNELEIHARVFEEGAELRLGIRTDLLSVVTSYKDLVRASYGQDERSSSQQGEEAEMRAVVDRRNFCRCLFGHLLQPRHAICFVFQNSVMMHLMGSLDVAVTYYIPQRMTLS